MQATRAVGKEALSSGGSRQRSAATSVVVGFELDTQSRRRPSNDKHACTQRRRRLEQRLVRMIGCPLAAHLAAIPSGAVRHLVASRERAVQRLNVVATRWSLNAGRQGTNARGGRAERVRSTLSWMSRPGQASKLLASLCIFLFWASHCSCSEASSARADTSHATGPQNCSR